MQATLAALGGIAGILIWWMGGGALFLAGGLLLLANWPWTLFAIKPVNDRLKGLLDSGEVEARAPSLLTRWAKLHSVRTMLGLGSTLVFAAAVAA